MNYNRENKIIKHLIRETQINKLIWERYDQVNKQEVFVTYLKVTDKKKIRVTVNKLNVGRNFTNFFIYFYFGGRMIKGIFYREVNEVFRLFAVIKYKQYLTKNVGVRNFLNQIIASGKVKWKEEKIHDDLIGFSFIMFSPKLNDTNQTLKLIIYKDRLIIMYDRDTIEFKRIDTGYFNKIKDLQESDI